MLILGLIALTAGCGGTSTKATPLATVPTTSTTATTPATTTGPSPRGATPPAASQLAVVESDLGAAGGSLEASDSAISAADVNQAKAQEGSAP